MATLKAVEVIPVSLPLKEPYRIARALQERGEYVETQADIVASARQHLAPVRF